MAAASTPIMTSASISPRPRPCSAIVHETDDAHASSCSSSATIRAWSDSPCCWAAADALHDCIADKYPTGALAEMRFESSRWRDVESGTGHARPLHPPPRPRSGAGRLAGQGRGGAGRPSLFEARRRPARCGSAACRRAPARIPLGWRASAAARQPTASARPIGNRHRLPSSIVADAVAGEDEQRVGRREGREHVPGQETPAAAIRRERRTSSPSHCCRVDADDPLAGPLPVQGHVPYRLPGGSARLPRRRFELDANRAAARPPDRHRRLAPEAAGPWRPRRIGSRGPGRRPRRS